MNVFIQILYLLFFSKKIIEKKIKNKISPRNNFKYFFSGRSAIYSSAKHFANAYGINSAILPEYLCNVVYLGFENANYKIDTYKFNNEFKINIEEIEKYCNENDNFILVITSLYGSDFTTIFNEKWFTKIINEKNIFCLIDICQDINLSKVASNYLSKKVFAVISFNDKSVKGLMGGAIISNNNLFLNFKFAKIPFTNKIKLLKWWFNEILKINQKRLINNNNKFEFSKCIEFPFTLNPYHPLKCQMIFSLFELKKLSLYNKIKQRVIQENFNQIIKLPFFQTSSFLIVNNLKNLNQKQPYAKYLTSTETLYDNLLIADIRPFYYSKKSYFTFSGYVNGYSLKKGCKKLDITLQNIGKPSAFFKKSIQIPQPKDFLLFTDEDNLKKYHNSAQYFFQPKEFDFRLIDDKLYFAEKLIEKNKHPIPYFPDSKNINYPVFFKSRYSYYKSVKYPRGFVCYNVKHLQEAKQEIKFLGLNEEVFFYQKYLEGPIENNISTCGYFDFSNNNLNIIITTQKLLGTDLNKTNATGAMICTIIDKWNLTKQTIDLLNVLKFKGAFELEFIIDYDQNIYFVELNPRFWMQHGIFISKYDNILLKRYFGNNTPYSATFKKIIWIDGLRIAQAILLLQIKYLKNFISIYKSKRKEKFKPIFYPNIIIGLIWNIIDKFKNIIKCNKYE